MVQHVMEGHLHLPPTSEKLIFPDHAHGVGGNKENENEKEKKKEKEKHKSSS